MSAIKIEQLEHAVVLLQQRIAAMETELVVAEEACITATKRKSTECQKRTTQVKKTKILLKKVRRLEIDALREVRVPKSSPTKRRRSGAHLRPNILRWAEDELKQLLKRYEDEHKVNDIVAAMYEMKGQPDPQLNLKSKLSTAYARSRLALCDLLPDDFLSKEHALAAQEVVDRIQERWKHRWESGS